MNRFSAYGRKDSQWREDGDLGWKGIFMPRQNDYGSVPQGFLAKGENTRLKDGPCVPRPGTTLPGDFNPGFEDYIAGSGIFKNPNGEEVMLVATQNANYIWQLQFNKDPVRIDLQAGQTIGLKLVEFVQSFDKVLLLRRPVAGDPVLVWDGNVANDFVPMTLIPPGITMVPAKWQGEPFADRIIYYNAIYPATPFRDEIIVSDVLNYSSYDNILGVFRINAGQADMITRVMGHFKSSIIIFMRGSVHMLENFMLKLEDGKQRQLSANFGSVGTKMPLQHATDVSFLSQPGGFYNISEIVQDQIAREPVPFSRPIQPIIDRINWARAEFHACSCLLGEYEFYALPLDHKSGANDAIVVRNGETGQWESAPDWWEDANFRISALHVTQYDNSRRVFAADYVAKKIYLLYDGLTDNVGNSARAVNASLDTRGYDLGDPSGEKRYERAVMGIRTYDPDITVSAISDGFNEIQELARVTKDRTRFYIHGHKDFEQGDDPDEPKREDYSVLDIENFAGEDFEELPDGGIQFLPASGLQPFAGDKQESIEAFLIQQHGRWLALRVEGSRGACDILGVKVEGHSNGETFRTSA